MSRFVGFGSPINLRQPKISNRDDHARGQSYLAAKTATKSDDGVAVEAVDVATQEGGNEIGVKPDRVK